MNFYSVCDLLESKRWTFAKTMAGIPHDYTLRDGWGNDDEFEYIVAYIREHGRQEKWGRYNHHYLYLSGYRYWTMSAPVSETVLINRARPQRSTPYDKIAPKYDNLFWQKQFIDENREMFRIVNPKGRILDIGCGTGLAIEWIKDLEPSNYVGIDPCKRMIDQLVWKHPRYAACIRSCFFEEYYGKGFDTIMALFGTASYFRGADRVLKMLNRGGVATLVYYASDYEPITDKLTGVNGGAIVSRPSGDNLIRWGNYVIERWVK